MYNMYVPDASADTGDWGETSGAASSRRGLVAGTGAASAATTRTSSTAGLIGRFWFWGGRWGWGWDRPYSMSASQIC
jgi:hypothetical protein